MSDSKLFTGIISAYDAGTYIAQINNTESAFPNFLQGYPLVNIFATALGFKECPPLPVGCSALCYYTGGSNCLVIGVIPSADIANAPYFSRACLKTADGKHDYRNTTGYNAHNTKQATFNSNRPTDVVTGEHVWANELGVLLGLFQELAVLKGSELSQVQCFLMDDLVRVISHNYQHFSALGEFKIYHDGKNISAEFGATHLSRESLGVAQITGDESTQVFDNDGNATVDDSTDYYKITQNEHITAIERFKLFLGRLSDFMHLFLVRPAQDTIRTLSGAADNTKFDTGLFDWHIGEDGRVSFRTVSGFSIEKTNWIMVPTRVLAPEDPAGDDGETITYEPKDPFVFDNSYTYQDNPIMYALQLRDCNAYLQDSYNYKNWLKQEKDFIFSKDSQNSQETKLNEIDQVDPQTKVKFKDYKLRRSGFYLMDNGGVMIKDAWGSAIILEGGNIYLQPAKDLVEQPLRHYVLKAGQCASIAAQEDVDVSSTNAGFRLKTKNVQHFCSTDQGIILESESLNKSTPNPTDAAYTDFGGILFKAEKTGVYSYADTILDRSTTIGVYKSKILNMESIKGDIMLLAHEGNIYGVADKDLFLSSIQQTVLSSQGDLDMAGENTNIGKQGKRVGLVSPPNSKNPVIVNGVIDLNDVTSPNADLLAFDGQASTVFDSDDKFASIEFRFLSSDVYKLTSGTDFIPMSIFQQDDDSLGGNTLKAWQEKPVNNTYPFPGSDMFESYYITSQLQNLQKVDNDIYSKQTDSLSSQASDLSADSLNNYKTYGNN